MGNFLLNISHWQWLGLAAILFIVEVLTGTGFLLCLGISASLVGVLLWVFSTIEATAQLFIFAIFSIITALGWKLYLHFPPMKTDSPKLNKRAEQYVDREFTLKTSIVNGYGAVHVDDTIWQVKCDEKLMADTSIRIIGTEGVILVAKKSDKI